MTTYRNLVRIFAISFFASMAGLLFGFDTGVISGALQFIVKTFHIANSQTALKEMIVASVPLGALLGAVVSKFVAHRLGRKHSIIATSVLFIVGTLLAVTAVDVNGVIIGRLIMGLAIGLSAMTVPMYLSELAPAKLRGAMVFCFQLSITIGLFAAFLINYIFAGSENWRMMFAIGLLPAVLLGLGMLLLPYSPRWLIMRNKGDKARQILAKLMHHSEVEHAFDQIKESCAYKNSRASALFCKPVRKVAIIAFMIFVFQQLSGINTIMYYAPTIYQKAGFIGARSQILASMVDGIAFILATVLGIWMVERAGRRKLFFIGFAGMVICLFVMGLSYQHIFTPQLEKAFILISIVCYIVFFGISAGPLAYLMMSELFPLNVKSSGMALASCGNWGLNVFVSATFLTLIHWITIANTFYFYAGCTLIGLIFCYLYIPETKGITLETIEKNLYVGKRSRDLGQVEA